MSQPKLDPALRDAISRIKAICAASQGRSQYFPYGGSGYKASVTHYFESSTEVAGGAVQPGSEEDLAKIVKVIAATDIEFAIKCGGHSTNPGFSSTEGIQICLSRLNNIVVDVPNKRVRVGAGCLFEELYQELHAHNINIVGGSGLAGVGLAGWMLGGGYSVKTSQYGLGVDNIESARVVLPDGTVKVTSDKEDKDLFFAIKGGGNNYGVVSEFTLKAHDQPKGKFYDHTFEYEPQHFSQVKKAICNFVEKVPEDNKANIEAAFRHYSQPSKVDPKVTLTVHCVYDGDYPTPDPFKEFKDIPDMNNEPAPPSAAYETGSFLFADLCRSYLNGTYDLVSTMAMNPKPVETEDIPELSRDKPPMNGIGQFPRGRWGNVMVNKFSLPIIEEIEKQSYEVAKGLGENGGTRIAIGLWPFTKSMFDNATNSAFPHTKGKPNCPIIAYFTWEGKQNDKHWIDTMKNTLGTLREKVQNSESKNLPYFINTALYEDTTVEDLYRDNLSKLKEVRQKYDPCGVMDRAGGFKIPLP